MNHELNASVKASRLRRGKKSPCTRVYSIQLHHNFKRYIQYITWICWLKKNIKNRCRPDLSK